MTAPQISTRVLASLSSRTWRFGWGSWVKATRDPLFLQLHVGLQCSLKSLIKKTTIPKFKNQ